MMAGGRKRKGVTSFMNFWFFGDPVVSTELFVMDEGPPAYKIEG